MTKTIVCAVIAAGMLAGCQDARLACDGKEAVWLSATDAPVFDGAVKGDSRATDGTSWFVSELVNEGEIRSARWMTAGLGVYEVYVNGVRVGDDFLKPGRDGV